MDAFICDAQRTPIGRYGGALSQVRTDDLAAIPLAALKERNPQVDWASLDDVILGDANQAGESNRNVARMAALLAGLPESVPGTTINRLCASGMDAVLNFGSFITQADAINPAAVRAARAVNLGIFRNTPTPPARSGRSLNGFGRRQ